MLGAFLSEVMNERAARAAKAASQNDPYSLLVERIQGFIRDHILRYGSAPSQIPMTSHEIDIMVTDWEMMMHGMEHPYRRGEPMTFAGIPVSEVQSPMVTSNNR